jgi:hypothetical protein
MILGAIKAKTNFPYDPNENALQSIVPVAKVKLFFFSFIVHPFIIPLL